MKRNLHDKMGAVRVADLNLNLPDELQLFVKSQVDAGQFKGPAEYIQALINRAKVGQEQLESLLIEGLDSGEAIPLDADKWKRIRQEVQLRLHDNDEA